MISPSGIYSELQWRHNGQDGVSNHQPLHCLLNRLFRRRSKKTSKLRVTAIWWRHRVTYSTESLNQLDKCMSFIYLCHKPAKDYILQRSWTLSHAPPSIWLVEASSVSATRTEKSKLLRIIFANPWKWFMVIQRTVTLPLLTYFVVWTPFQYPIRHLIGYWNGILSLDLTMHRSREIGSGNGRIALKFDRQIGSSTANVPVKFQSDRTMLNADFTRSHDKDSYRILLSIPMMRSCEVSCFGTLNNCQLKLD